MLIGYVNVVATGGLDMKYNTIEDQGMITTTL